MWVEALAASVKAGKESLNSIASSMSEQWAKDVQEHLAKQGYTSTAEAKRIMMQYQREERDRRKELFQNLKAAGANMYNPSQQCFTDSVREHLDGCEARVYPSARSTASVVAGENATKLLGKSNKKKLHIALQENEQHPGMRRVHSVAERSAVIAATTGSVSCCLGALASHHKVAVRLYELELDNAAKQQENATIKARLASLEARRDIENQGKNWKTAALSIRAAEPNISNRALAARVGVSETTIRKYIKPAM